MKPKLDFLSSLKYALVLKNNILGKDKQEKVNSIVVLAKLLDVIRGDEINSNDFKDILDHSLFRNLFAIIYSKMSTDTYKAVLKICARMISGSSFYSGADSINLYLPLYESLIEYPDVIDIIQEKLFLRDYKITYNSIMLIADLMSRALKFRYSGIIVLVSRLKSVSFFSCVAKTVDLNDDSTLEAVNKLIYVYYNLYYYLHSTRFDLSIKSHQAIVNELFSYLESSLIESDAPMAINDYIKTFFTENPKTFVVDNFTILLAMDLKKFLEDQNLPFKKKFHEELMINSYDNAFPIYLFMNNIIDMWMSVFQNRERYPNVYTSILYWEQLIYHTMYYCLTLWQDTKARLDDPSDIDKILSLFESKVDDFEESLNVKSIEESLSTFSYLTSEELRKEQVDSIRIEHEHKWDRYLKEFDRNLSREILEFICEQRVAQLVKGSWVYTDTYGEAVLGAQKKLPKLNFKYYFILLSPNRRSLCYKEFVEKPAITPSYDEMEVKSIKLTDILDFKAEKVGKSVGEEDKKKNSMLVSIRGTISYEKITLVGENNSKLLSFYTDTKVMKYNWLDGLRLLKGATKKGQLSSETESQRETLFKMRRNIQMLSLESENVKTNEINGISSDDETDEVNFYDLDELTAASDNFFYR